MSDIKLGLPAEGFEPPTYGLQNRCTTTVLSRQMERRRFYRIGWLVPAAYRLARGLIEGASD
jgi:hypothetical protein